MIRCASANSREMTGLWWQIDRLSGEVDDIMGWDMCEFDQYGINRKFFTSLINMNTAPDNYDMRRFSSASFIFPKEVNVTNNILTVTDLVSYHQPTTMVNTGLENLYVGQYIGIVPPLSRRDAYIVTAFETGCQYMFPNTVEIQQYNTELIILLKSLTLLQEEKNGKTPDEFKSCAGKVAILLNENKIFSAMDSTGFPSNADALLHLLDIFNDSSVVKPDSGKQYTKGTILSSLGTIIDGKEDIEKKIQAMDMIYRDRSFFLSDTCQVTERCKIEASYENSNNDVGPLRVGHSCFCNVRVVA